MEIRLLAMLVCKPRDLLRARQRARQIAGLLGFEPRQQAALAAEVFAVLRRAKRPSLRARLTFLVADRCLKVDIDAGGLRFSTALPETLPHAIEDVAWMIRALDRQTPFSIIEELETQNRELLAAARLADGPMATPEASGRRHVNEAAA